MHTHNVEKFTGTNLYQAITDLLRKHAHPRPEAWTLFLSPDAHSTSDLYMQRYYANRAWRNILEQVKDKSTMDERYCLVNNGLINDWVRLFEAGVIPCIIQYELPLP